MAYLLIVLVSCVGLQTSVAWAERGGVEAFIAEPEQTHDSRVAHGFDPSAYFDQKRAAMPELLPSGSFARSSMSAELEVPGAVVCIPEPKPLPCVADDWVCRRQMDLHTKESPLAQGQVPDGWQMARQLLGKIGERCEFSNRDASTLVSPRFSLSLVEAAPGSDNTETFTELGQRLSTSVGIEARF